MERLTANIQQADEEIAANKHDMDYWQQEAVVLQSDKEDVLQQVTATKLDNCLARKDGNNKSSSYQLFHGKPPTFIKHMRIFGEAGIVAIRKGMQKSLDNRGVKCIFVGYEMKSAKC